MLKFIETLSISVLVCLALQVESNKLPPPCHSAIYCNSTLLHTVQMNKIYDDSKTFVDMKMRKNAEITMKNFYQFMEEHQQDPSREDVLKFVDDNFEPAGSEFEDWIPADWTESPAYIKNIVDGEYKEFAYALNGIWKELGRKMKDEIKEEKDLYSIIWVPNPVIVPGGRFREFYYWDSYWIILGLLLSEMHQTARGMLSNFAYIINEYGHIPNGGRIYYLQRSQPPLFIPMVKLYEDFTKDTSFIEQYINVMDKEFNFWMTNHSRIIERDGNNYTLLAYGDYSSGPRPESYSEDVESGRIFNTTEEKEMFYSELKAAAESGWDFSSRWFITNNSEIGNLTDIKTRSIIPVDLNAYIYWNAVILAEWHEQLGNVSKAQYYKDVAESWLAAIEAILWHEEVGAWLDYDMQNSNKRDFFFPSNIAPLWAGAYNKSNTKHISDLVLKYLEKNNALYPGGIPTSRHHTGEQWDFPNAWPPLQHMMIIGLHNTGEEAAQNFAYEIAQRWVQTNYKAYNETEAMFEKYDASVLGGHGGGGEYEVQLGFGWSNGVIMDLLHRYGDRLSYIDHESLVVTPNIIENSTTSTQISSSKIGQFLTGFVALVVTIAAGYIGISIYKRRNGYQYFKGTNTRPSRSKYSEMKNENSRRVKTFR